MLRFAAFVAMIALAAPANSETRRVVGERDGISYDYTAELLPDGNLLLRGIYLDTTERFRFTVAPNGRVAGWVDNRAVRFNVGRQARDRAVAGLRPRGGLVAQQSAGR